MKVNIKVSLGKATDPAPTIAHFTQARWDRQNRWVQLSGTVYCQGSHWKHTHIFYIPLQLRLAKLTREQILEEKFGDAR